MTRNNPSVLYNLGKAYMKVNEPFEAELQFSKIISQLCPNYKAYEKLGTFFHQQHDFENAIGMYDKALEIKPDCAKLYMNKGSSLISLEKFNDAIKMYDRAIQIDPNNIEAYRNKGNALRESRNYPEALQVYDQAIKIQPNQAEFYLNKGSLLSHLAKTHDALQMYEKVLQFNPNHKEALFKRLNVQKRAKESRKKKLEDNVDASQLNYQKFYDYGQLYCKFGLINKSQEMYIKGMNEQIMQMNIFQKDIFQKQLSELDSIFEKKSELFPIQQDYNVLKRQDDSQFVDKKEVLFLINPNCIKSLIMKGNVLFLMGRNSEALEIYHRAIQIKELQQQNLDKKNFPKGNLKQYSLQEEQQKYRILSIPLLMAARILEQKGDTLAEEYYKQAFKLEPKMR